MVKKIKTKFAHLHLGIGWYDLLQIWYVDLPTVCRFAYLRGISVVNLVEFG